MFHLRMSWHFSPDKEKYGAGDSQIYSDLMTQMKVRLLLYHLVSGEIQVSQIMFLPTWYIGLEKLLLVLTGAK